MSLSTAQTLVIPSVSPNQPTATLDLSTRQPHYPAANSENLTSRAFRILAWTPNWAALFQNKTPKRPIFPTSTPGPKGFSYSTLNSPSKTYPIPKPSNPQQSTKRPNRINSPPSRALAWTSKRKVRSTSSKNRQIHQRPAQSRLGLRRGPAQRPLQGPLAAPNHRKQHARLQSARAAFAGRNPLGGLKRPRLAGLGEAEPIGAKEQRVDRARGTANELDFRRVPGTEEGLPLRTRAEQQRKRKQKEPDPSEYERGAVSVETDALGELGEILVGRLGGSQQEADARPDVEKQFLPSLSGFQAEGFLE